MRLAELKCKIDLPTAFASLGIPLTRPNHRGWTTDPCPLGTHEDNHPSFGVNVRTGAVKCHGCGFKGDIISLAARLWNVPLLEAAQRLAKEQRLAFDGPVSTSTGKEPKAKSHITADSLTPTVESADRDSTKASWDDHPLGTTEERLAAWQRALRTSSQAHKLLKMMGLSLEAAEAFGIGYGEGRVMYDDCFDGWRLMIPVRDTKGTLRSLLCYHPGMKKGKILPLRTGMETCLFGLPYLPSGFKTILITEGPKDCMFALHHKLQAVTGTGGASTWKDEWSRELADMGYETAIVLYDHDDAGRDGTETVCRSLVKHGIKALVAHWPDGSPEGYDLADYFAAGGTTKQLKADIINKAIKWHPSIYSDRPVGPNDLDDVLVHLDGKPVIQLAKRFSQSAKASALSEIMARQNTFFLRGSNVWRVGERQIAALFVPDDLMPLLHAVVECATLASRKTTKETTDGTMATVVAQYAPVPRPVLLTVLRSPACQRSFPRILHVTKAPQFDENLQLLRPGYDRRTQIYYMGDPVKPAATINQLETLLEEFAWRDRDADRTNFVGAMLTLLLITQFVGTHPMVAVMANQPSTGKSLLVQLLAILSEGQPVGTITYSKDDAELEKHIAAKIAEGTTVVVLDNVRLDNPRDPVIRSGVLERCVTSLELSFRRLGSNTSITAPNTFLFMLTLNEGDMSRDLVTRTLPVNLLYEGDPTTRTYQEDDLLAYAREHRPAILGELVGMVERWRDAGQPAFTGTTTRFPAWSEMIGGILEFNGFEGFLENLSQTATEVTSGQDAYVQLVEAVAAAGGIGKKLTAARVVTIAKKAKLYREITKRSGQAAAVSMAKRILAPNKNVKITLTDGSIVCLRAKVDHAEKKRVYGFVKIDAHDLGDTAA